MADTPLTSRKIIQKPDIVIDPNFPAPPGIADVRQGEQSTRRLSEYTEAGGYNLPPGEEPEVIDPVTPGEPGEELPDDGSGPIVTTPLIAPTNLRIVSQTQRFNPDGTYVVDAVLEFDDVQGAISYDVRLTKAGEGEIEGSV